MNEPKILKRGELHFRYDIHEYATIEWLGHPDDADVTIECWLGHPDDAESERIFIISEQFVPSLIAGLRAINKIKK